MGRARLLRPVARPAPCVLRAFMASTQDAGDRRGPPAFPQGLVHGRGPPFAPRPLRQGPSDVRRRRRHLRPPHAAGFVRLWSLPTRTMGRRATGRGSSPAEMRQDQLSWAGTAPSSSSALRSWGGEARPRSAWEGGQAPALRTASTQLWIGAVQSSAGGGPAIAFTRSISFDMRLPSYDVSVCTGTRRALGRAGLLRAVGGRHRRPRRSTTIAADVEDGTFSLHQRTDVHSAIEHAFTERLGDLGAEVPRGGPQQPRRYGPRLWTRDAASALASGARELAGALAAAQEHLGAVMPGHTHVQRGQPVCSASTSSRTRSRWSATRSASGPPRRRRTARRSERGAARRHDPPHRPRRAGHGRRLRRRPGELDRRGERPRLRARVPVAATPRPRCTSPPGRGPVLVLARVQLRHARRRLRDPKSSMMPQKKNPDVAELARGKAGRVVGDLVRLATVLRACRWRMTATSRRTRRRPSTPSTRSSGPAGDGRDGERSPSTPTGCARPATTVRPGHRRGRGAGRGGGPVPHRAPPSASW